MPRPAAGRRALRRRFAIGGDATSGSRAILRDLVEGAAVRAGPEARRGRNDEVLARLRRRCCDAEQAPAATRTRGRWTPSGASCPAARSRRLRHRQRIVGEDDRHAAGRVRTPPALKARHEGASPDDRSRSSKRSSGGRSRSSAGVLLTRCPTCRDARVPVGRRRRRQRRDPAGRRAARASTSRPSRTGSSGRRSASSTSSARPRSRARASRCCVDAGARLERALHPVHARPAHARARLPRGDPAAISSTRGDAARAPASSPSSRATSSRPRGRPRSLPDPDRRSPADERSTREEILEPPALPLHYVAFTAVLPHRRPAPTARTCAA